MNKQCKIDHADPEAVPQIFCRACHPELVRTPEQRSALDAKDAEASRVAQARLKKEQELARTEVRLEKLEKRKKRHGGELSGVDATVYASLTKKAERLEGELNETKSKG